MAPPSVSMLWETVDPEAALTSRFGFATADDTVRWLAGTLASRYKIELRSVDRLVISAGKLMAWTLTSEGPLIVKASMYPGEHPRLQAIAELLAWLQRDGFPVSALLPTPDGELQLELGDLSVGVQRVFAADMLDPTRLDQVARAGTTLARLHEAFIRYPQPADLDHKPAPVPFETDIAEWLEKNTPDDPRLRPVFATLQRRAAGLDSAGLDTQLIHLDFRAANILWAGGDIVAVLDFEQIARGYRITDVAHTATLLGTLFHNWGPLSAAARTAFLVAYQERLPLSEKERAWLGVLTLRQAIGMAGPGSMQEQWLAAAEQISANIH